MANPQHNPAGDPAALIVQKFLASKRILVVDEGSSSRSSVVHLMVQLGALPFNIIQAKTFPEAQEEMTQKVPGVVVAEYNLGKYCGLELLQSQRALNPDTKSSLFMLTTSNSSQAAVARAAEEDVDAFILKPFSPETFKKTILKAAIFKLQPPPYILEIEAGKKLMEQGKFDEAEASFTKAMGMDPQPALACYYLGQIKYVKKVLDQSKGSYSQGLDFNKIHYKCLIGLYELLMDQKAHDQAYEVVKKVSQYFPANPKRLAEVLRLAIINRSYDDVEKYYQIFCNIDERNDTLVRYICAALVVCGKYYILSGNRSRALELFQKAAVTSAGRVNILAEIVKTLCDCKCGAEAQKFLSRFPAETHKSSEYLISLFLVEAAAGQASMAINKGRELVAKGIATDRVYEVMVNKFIELKSLPAAVTLAEEAVNKFPNLKGPLGRTLEDAKKQVAEVKQA